MKTKKNSWLALALCALCACSDSGERTVFVRNVYLVRPEAAGKEEICVYPGVVEAAREVDLGFKTAGQLSRICVEEGDFVRRGQLLAELDAEDYRLGVEALQIQYDQLADEVRRTRQLYGQKSISANDYEKAEAGLRRLGVQLRAEKNRLGYTKLRAPVDGYVRAVNFSEAEMVDAGTAVFSLFDASRMEVTADIPQGDYLRRGFFTGFSCRAEGLGADFPLALLSLTPRADGNQLYRLRLALAGEAGRRLTAGMNVEVEITVSDTAAARGFSVPLSAVFRNGGEACVWVLAADSTVRKRPVRLGGTDGAGRALVRSGLTGGEQLVEMGTGALQEGEKVCPVPAPGESNVGGLL